MEDICYALATGKKSNNHLINDMSKLTRFFEGISALVADAIRASNHPQAVGRAAFLVIFLDSRAKKC